MTIYEHAMLGIDGRWPWDSSGDTDGKLPHGRASPPSFPIATG